MPSLFPTKLTIEIGHFEVAVQVKLNDETVVAYEITDAFVGKDLFMHLGAVNAAALFEEQNKSLAIGTSFFEVFSQIQKRVPHPVLFVLTIIAQFRRNSRKRQYERECATQ